MSKVECFKCGAMVPRFPGVPNTVNVACAHVCLVIAEPDIAREPSPTVGIERARKLYKLEQATMFADVKFWDAELVEGDHPAIPDPDHWTGACRSEGASW